MIVLEGKGVSKGTQKGKLYFYRRAEAGGAAERGEDPAQESRRLAQAKERAGEALGALADKAREEAGEDAAILFETHAMFLEDEDFTGAMESRIEEGYSAEYAVEQAGEEFAQLF